MSQYQSSPIGRSNTQQAVGGLPAYLLGSYNRSVQPTLMRISTVALAGTTATVVGTVIEGQIPVVGQLISIAGAVPSYFNVTNVAVASVSAAAAPDLGVFTLTFTLANSGIATTASPGIAVMPQLEVGDSLVLGGAGGWSSAALAIQSNAGPPTDNSRGIRFDVTFPVLPGAATIVAQTAEIDLDTDYKTLATVATVVGGVLSAANASGKSVAVVVSGVVANFTRFNISGIAAGGAATVVGKVTV